MKKVLYLLIVCLLFVGCGKNGEIDNIPEEKEGTEEKEQVEEKVNPYIGIYEQVSEYATLKLELKSDNSFSMDINLCEGIATIVGEYEVKNNKIVLSFESYQYFGFDGEEDVEYTLIILDESNLLFKSLIGKSGVCGPYKEDIFVKKS